MSDDTATVAYQRAMLLLERGRWAEAETYLRESLTANPENAHGVYCLAVSVFQQEGREKEAFEILQRAIALEPEEAEFFVMRSSMHRFASRNAQALADAERAVALDPQLASTHGAHADAFCGLSRWNEAEAAARRALALDADESRAASLLAHALAMQQRQPEHEEHLRDWLARDPQDPAAHASAGWRALQSDDSRTAETHFREALRINAHYEPARSGLLQSFKARSAFYRLYLRYCFFMARLSPRARWGLILGLYFVAKFLRIVFSGSWAPLGMLIMAVYALFVLWTHLSAAIGSSIVLVDRSARHALKPPERVEGLVVGCCLLGGIGVLLVAAVARTSALIGPGLALVGAAVPLAYTFTNESASGRLLFGMMGGLVLLSGLVHALGPGLMPESVRAMAFWVALVAVMATTWLANVPALHR